MSKPTLRIHWKVNNVAIDKDTDERVGLVRQEGRREWFAETPFFDRGAPSGPHRTRRLARKWLEEKVRAFRAQAYQPPKLPADQEPRRAPHAFNGKPDGLDQEVISNIRKNGGKWAVFENKDLSSSEVGRLVCLRYGEGCTFTTPPDKAPDSKIWGHGWCYFHVGFVNLETGLVQEVEPNERSANEAAI